MDRAISVARTCNLPFDTVANQLETNAAAVIQPATEAAATAANEIVLTLDSKWAWFDVHESVKARIGELTRTWSEASLPLSWDASEHKRLLPSVSGKLSLYAMSSKYTEISYRGHYAPPAGLLGSVSDRLLGHRVVDAAIGHLLDQVVAHLEQQNPLPVGA